ncbi:MAG: phosphate ABC transporter permease PstA [Planctomycetales bacterium]|nr:phosphate ABC transporter permease PstA [Planctomycetales bacterium]
MNDFNPTPFEEYELVSHARRARFEKWFRALCIMVSGLSVLLLVLLLGAIAFEGGPYLTSNFLTNLSSSNPEKCGIFGALIGSMLVCVTCAIFTMPIGVAAAIFLEEYKPRSKTLRFLHSSLELLISNLAGVPSVVYGLLGLSAFVHMFGVFGTIQKPSFEMGARYYYQYESLQEGRMLLVPVAGVDSERPELVDDMTVYTSGLNPIQLRLFDRGEKLPSEPEELRRSLYRNSPASPTKRTSWYFVQFPFGYTVIAGALTLMLVVLPVVIISSQESLRAVPPSLREGAFGLGCTRWQVVWNTTLPSALPGIMTGAILSMSRAIGEAAPIVLVSGVGFLSVVPSSLMSAYTVMPLQIYHWSDHHEPAFFDLAAAGIMVLLAVLFVFNLAAVLVRQFAQRQLH